MRPPAPETAASDVLGKLGCAVVAVGRWGSLYRAEQREVRKFRLFALQKGLTDGAVCGVRVCPVEVCQLTEAGDGVVARALEQDRGLGR